METATPLHVSEDESPARVVWALAWPAVALNSLQVVNNLLDSFFIGHLTEAALIAYGGLMNMLFLLFSLAMALGTGTTALVSRAYGAGQVQEFRTACKQSLSLALLVSVILAALGAAMSGLAAQVFMRADQQEAQRLMVEFLGIYALGLPATYLIQTLAAALRGVGDTKSPMVISGIQILLHIGLNFVLIFPSRDLGSFTLPGANLGLAGAAWAITISGWMSALGYLVYSGRTPLGAAWQLAMPRLLWIRRILKIAIPSAMMAFLRVGSLAAFTIIIKNAYDGAAAIAAMRPAFAIESIMFMPAFGLSMAASALVGQSLGMGKPERAERLGWTAAHHAALVTLLLCAPIFIFAHPIAGLLIEGKPAIAHETALLLQYLCVTEIGFAYAMVTIGAMQGAGDTVRPLWITIISLWLLRVPLAWVLVTFTGMGADGAWLAMSVSQLLQGGLAVWAFRSGQWKLKKV